MSVPRKPLSSTSIHLLKQLVQQDKPRPEWNPQELGEILRHQLAAPLELELAPGAIPDAKTQRGIKTFADLFMCPAPSLEVLKAVKDFAKSHIDQADAPVPREVASVLYYACIILARRHHATRITTLSDAGLRKGVQWLLHQDWLGEAERSVLTDGIAAGE